MLRNFRSGLRADGIGTHNDQGWRLGSLALAYDIQTAELQPMGNITITDQNRARIPGSKTADVLVPLLQTVGTR